MKDLDTIFLVGMPGSGKSTFGKQLASYLSFEFLDTDSLIEKREGKSIPEIFSENGEAYFRKVEQSVLLELDAKSTVVATGGGMPCFFENMAVINQKGFSVFLDIPVKVLAERVIKQGNRPLLPEKELDELVASLAKKYNERKVYYQKANISLFYPEITIGAFNLKLN